ncbi:MAG: NAD-dependent deacylase [Saprospiraceae bacterium]|nr:NAD-dependent deacylase [Saprospiraceae bacterium]
MKPKIVVLTGAGISAESGLQTFRGADGLWEGHQIMDVASLLGWNQNPQLVLNFYNERRKQLLRVAPNAAHHDLAKLEADYEVSIVTQNVDDLHERAGSKHVVHLHGELLKVRSAVNENLVYPWIKDLKVGDLAEDGTQLRPHIVWFGELVPLIEVAALEMQMADVLLIVGTSLQVYPAASLIQYVTPGIPIMYIDPFPATSAVSSQRNLRVFETPATLGVSLCDQRHSRSVLIAI